MFDVFFYIKEFRIYIGKRIEIVREYLTSTGKKIIFGCFDDDEFRMFGWTNVNPQIILCDFFDKANVVPSEVRE